MLHQIIRLIFLLLVVIPIAGRDNATDYTFKQSGNNYSFQGSFFISSKPENITGLVCDFNNIAAYSADARSITLVQTGQNWYDVSFIYQRLGFIKNHSTWHRELYPDDHIIRFTMISNSTSPRFLPQIEKSSGFYQVRPEYNGSRIIFYQEGQVSSGWLSKTYIKLAEIEAVDFLAEFRIFIESNSALSLKRSKQGK